MKRYQGHKSAFVIAALSGAFLMGCDEAAMPVPVEKQDEQWREPPSVTDVNWKGETATVSGVADPGGRVVFIVESGQSYAATADTQGSFSLSVMVPPEGLLLQPRLQTGRSTVGGPGQLFIAPREVGLAAVLFPGDPSYRLTGNGPLDAVDRDGEAQVISGRATGGRATQLDVNGRAIDAHADANGRWAVVVPSSGAPSRIVVAGRSYDVPGYSADTSDFSGRVGHGWLVRRNFGDGAVQSTWFPLDK